MKRRQYNLEFKREAARMMVMEEATAPEVSQKLGVDTGTLYRWKKEFLSQIGGEKSEVNGLTPIQMAEEIDRLRKALGKEKRITEILKKTVTYFSKDEL